MPIFSIHLCLSVLASPLQVTDTESKNCFVMVYTNVTAASVSIRLWMIDPHFTNSEGVSNIVAQIALDGEREKVSDKHRNSSR